MDAAAKEIAALNKEDDRLEEKRVDAWDRMDVLKARIDEIDRQLGSETQPRVRQSLEKELTGLKTDYIRADRDVMAVASRRLEIEQRREALGDIKPQGRDGLVSRRDMLLQHMTGSRDALQDMREAKNLIGVKHHQMELDVLQKEYRIIQKKLGEPVGFPFSSEEQEPSPELGLDSGPAFER